MNVLQKDYGSMKNMMFGDYLGFATLMQSIGEMERKINSLTTKYN